MLQDVLQPSLRALGQLRLASVVHQETTQETDRLRHHLGNSRTGLLKERVFLETPMRHPVSPGGAPRHHNPSSASYRSFRVARHTTPCVCRTSTTRHKFLPGCHPFAVLRAGSERSEGSPEMLRCAQHDKPDRHFRQAVRVGRGHLNGDDHARSQGRSHLRRPVGIASALRPSPSMPGAGCADRVRPCPPARPWQTPHRSLWASAASAGRARRTPAARSGRSR